jgi:hypothetical protein
MVRYLYRAFKSVTGLIEMYLSPNIGAANTYVAGRRGEY